MGLCKHLRSESFLCGPWLLISQLPAMPRRVDRISSASVLHSNTDGNVILQALATLHQVLSSYADIGAPAATDVRRRRAWECVVPGSTLCANPCVLQADLGRAVMLAISDSSERVSQIERAAGRASWEGGEVGEAKERESERERIRERIRENQKETQRESEREREM